jgi:hypothetical protein
MDLLIIAETDEKIGIRNLWATMVIWFSIPFDYNFIYYGKNTNGHGVARMRLSFLDTHARIK